jgi:hypothetical protein
MANASSINIVGFVDSIKASGYYYYVHDIELRRLINDIELDNPDDAYIPTSRLIVEKLGWFYRLQSIWTIIGTDITDVQATIDSIIGGEPNGSGE